MEPKCGATLDAAAVQGLVPAATFAKYARFAQESFVASRPDLRGCPAPGCTNAIKVGSCTGAHTFKDVRCSCGTRFCFNCSREYHYPLSCKQLDAWNDKGKSESETARWVQVSTIAQHRHNKP